MVVVWGGEGGGGGGAAPATVGHAKRWHRRKGGCGKRGWCRRSVDGGVEGVGIGGSRRSAPRQASQAHRAASTAAITTPGDPPRVRYTASTAATAATRACDGLEGLRRRLVAPHPACAQQNTLIACNPVTLRSATGASERIIGAQQPQDQHATPALTLRVPASGGSNRAARCSCEGGAACSIRRRLRFPAGAAEAASCCRRCTSLHALMRTGGRHTCAWQLPLLLLPLPHPSRFSNGQLEGAPALGRLPARRHVPVRRASLPLAECGAACRGRGERWAQAAMAVGGRRRWARGDGGWPRHGAGSRACAAATCNPAGSSGGRAGLRKCWGC